MNTNNGVLQAKQFLRSVDWKLLVFLVLVLNVKLVVKLFAIILIYLWRPDFKFGFHIKNSRLPLFYPVIIGIALINLVLRTTDLKNYLPSFLMGIGFWMICLLTIHQLKIFIERNQPAVIHRTLAFFFLLNAAVSMITLLSIMIETGSINPYTYQGEFQKYFISTGDYIKGISFDTSTTNAVINAFGTLYFFTRKNFSFFLVCVIMMVMTGSNLVNLVFAGALLFIFIFRSARAEKSLIIVSLLLIVVFLAKISPQNNQYINESVSRIFKETNKEKNEARAGTDKFISSESSKIEVAKTYLDSVSKTLLARLDEKKHSDQPEIKNALDNWQEKPALPEANIHSATYQYREDSSNRKALIQLASSLHTLPSPVVKQKRLPGKMLAMQQTFQYLKGNPGRLLTGTGMGNFSSKLAFKTTALNIAGGFPKRFVHIDSAFANNHLPLFLSYFAGQARYHSVIHSPNSVYDQTLAEYGIAGLLALIFLYFGFFAKKFRKLSYGLPLLIIAAALFFMEYWFEQLSVLFLLELLLFLNSKEGNHA
jgi:hypothetical protein